MLDSLNEIAQSIIEFRNKHLTPAASDSDRNSFVYAVGALLSLSTRNICPATSPSLCALLEKTISSVSAKPIIIDDTEFANVLISIANQPALLKLASENSFQADYLSLFDSISQNKDLEDLVQDPLLVGWLNQIQNKARENYDARRQKKCLNELSNLTQWYTPAWIAKILTSEVFPDLVNGSANKEIFLDPASGTGHLLVPAYLHLVSKSNKSIKAISNILQNQLFGLDIDSQAIKISGFSIYLATRDVAGLHDFPLPRLYSFSEESKSFGSYLLGCRSTSKSDELVSLDNKTLPLSVLPKKFDAITANPPYLSNRLIPKTLKLFLKQNYKDSHYDLYTSFLELSSRLLSESGRASFICQQSFLSIQRYEGLRRKLLNQCKLKTVAQLGKGIFATRQGEKVNSAIITISKEPVLKNDFVSVLSREDDYLKRAHRSYEEIENIINSVPGYPLVVWCPNEIAALFKSCQPLENPDSGITCTNGLFTCNNKRFVKHFSALTDSDKKHFVPYDKGGAKKWFYTTPYFLEWIDNGAEIRAYRKERGQSESLPGEDYYFKPGITYSYIGPSGFKARLLSPNSIFDIASSAIFCSPDKLNYLLGFLNSSLVRYILGILNPTVNFQIGDLRKLPYIEPDQITKSKVSSLSKRAIDIAIKFEKYNLDSPAFEKSTIEQFIPKQSSTITLANNAKIQLHKEINLAQIEEFEIQKEIDELVFNLYKISDDLRMLISKDPWVNQDSFSQIKKLDSGNLSKYLEQYIST